jgi:hypothetical protein
MLTKGTRKRIAQLEAGLRYIATQSQGHTRDSQIGHIHQCAREILSGETRMVAVRVRRPAIVDGLDYFTVYGSCPPQFFSHTQAAEWAWRLNGAPASRKRLSYKVVEIDGSPEVDRMTGIPKKLT